MLDTSPIEITPESNSNHLKVQKKIAEEYAKALKETGLDKKKLKNPMKTLARKLRPKRLSFSSQIKEMYRREEAERIARKKLNQAENEQKITS